MSRDGRIAYDRALRPAREAAYPPGEFVGQESFMRASEIRDLAVRAGVEPGATVLDLCCGVAGPGRFITAELGCRYVGVDASPGAIEIARERAAGLPCRFEVAGIPPVPAGPFDVVLLLETLLAFEDKGPLLRGIASALPVGGSFALTVEEGRPLTATERAAMPRADTVWPVSLPDLLRDLERVGFAVRWVEECSAAHREAADSLIRAFSNEAAAIDARLGPGPLDALLAGHRLWSEWLVSGRVRKFALVAEKTGRTGTVLNPAGGAPVFSE